MQTNRIVVESAKKLIINCMGMQKNEKLLIVADENTSDLGYCFVVAGRECAFETTYVEAPAQSKGEPPAPVAAAMEAADVEFLLTSMSYSHIKARIAASEKGARIASMPRLNTEIAENYLDTDYNLIKKVSERLSAILSNAKSVRAVTDKGTDITFSAAGRKCHADTGMLTEKGAFGNIPAGEAFFAPIETIGTGKIVVDCCIGYVGPVKDDVTLTLKDGCIVDIAGNKSAKELKEFLADKDSEALGIAEFGVGTNPGAKIIGQTLLDEKVWGTIHIAFGMNLSFGGTRQSNIHYDCILIEPTVWVDGSLILDKGKHVY